jgi:hypothetical protein
MEGTSDGWNIPGWITDQMLAHLREDGPYTEEDYE